MKSNEKIYLLIFIVILLIIFYVGIAYPYKRTSERSNEVILNNVIKEKDSKTEEEKDKFLQSIYYSNPIKIDYFDNFIVEVYPKTLDKEKEALRKDDENDNLDEVKRIRKGKGYDYEEEYREKKVFNILFMDKDYQNVTLLLDKKALILSYKSPSVWISDEKNQKKYENKQVDSTQFKKYSFFLYDIVFEDTNKDGKLTQEDKSNYYISDVYGKNFRAIAQNIEVVKYEFLPDKNMLFFTYFERNNNKRDKKRKFGIYSLENNTFAPLEKIHKALQKVEKILIEK